MPAGAAESEARTPEDDEQWVRRTPVQLHPTSRSKSGSWTGVLAPARRTSVRGGPAQGEDFPSALVLSDSRRSSTK
jgi:hypothetical protein